MRGRALGPGRLEKREGSWVLTWTDEHGDRQRRVLSTERRAAERIRSEIIQRRDMALAGLGSEAGQDLTLAEIVLDYLTDLRPRVSPRHFQTVSARLDRILSDLDGMRVGDLKPMHAVRLRNNASAAGNSNRTSNLVVQTLQAVLRWAEENMLIAQNPIGRVKPLPYSREHHRYRRGAMTTPTEARTNGDESITHLHPPPLLARHLEHNVSPHPVLHCPGLVHADIPRQSKRSGVRVQDACDDATGGSFVLESKRYQCLQSLSSQSAAPVIGIDEQYGFGLAMLSNDPAKGDDFARGSQGDCPKSEASVPNLRDVVSKSRTKPLFTLGCTKELMDVGIVIQSPEDIEIHLGEGSDDEVACRDVPVRQIHDRRIMSDVDQARHASLGSDFGSQFEGSAG